MPTRSAENRRRRSVNAARNRGAENRTNAGATRIQRAINRATGVARNAVSASQWRNLFRARGMRAARVLNT